MKSNGFTYQKEDTVCVLETFEWDNVWHEHSTDPTLPRALLIGDSISCGYRAKVNRLLCGVAYADSFASSKSIDNPFLLESLRLFIAQVPRCDCILLNNGLHGWHLGTDAYKAHYENLLHTLRAAHPKIPISPVLTTPICAEKHRRRLHERNQAVCERNAAVCALAKDLDMQILDLYTPFYRQYRLFSADGVHLTARGYQKAAALCAEFLKQKLL